jgi:beta-barrel assembly-enhancing protease
MKRVVIFLLAAALSRPTVGAEALPDLGDPSQAVLSLQQERQLGESIMRQIRASNEYDDDPELNDYINGLGYKLVANSPNAEQSFQFFLIDDPTINAFALPGGFVGVFTGLIVLSESESELAGVLAHEIGHVTQHHIARLFQKQQQAGMLSLAAMALALLAARSSPDLAGAAMAGAQYAQVQTQLNFTRDNEREADRIGVQTLEKAGFDPRAMPVFLERMQRAYRVYDSNAPSYVRTHPLTYERIADVESRVDALPYRQVPDSLSYRFVKARLQVEQYPPRDALAHFEDVLREKKKVSEPAARYGLVLALMRLNDVKRANREVDVLQTEVPENAMVAALAGRVKIAAGDLPGALRLYAGAVQRFPRQRGLTIDYAQALLDAKQPREALDLIDGTLQAVRSDPRLYRLQAKAYAALGQRLQQHRAQAEAYVLLGSIPAAIEQLQIGLKTGDGDYYQLSSAEARLRQLRAADAETRRR